MSHSASTTNAFHQLHDHQSLDRTEEPSRHRTPHRVRFEIPEDSTRRGGGEQRVRISSRRRKDCVHRHSVKGRRLRQDERVSARKTRRRSERNEEGIRCHHRSERRRSKSRSKHRSRSRHSKSVQVPDHFLCPIGYEIMKDPVSIDKNKKCIVSQNNSLT